MSLSTLTVSAAPRHLPAAPRVVFAAVGDWRDLKARLRRLLEKVSKIDRSHARREGPIITIVNAGWFKRSLLKEGYGARCGFLEKRSRRVMIGSAAFMQQLPTRFLLKFDAGRPRAEIGRPLALALIADHFIRAAVTG